MVIRVRISLGTPVLPIYPVVEKVLDFADIVVDSKQQKYDFGIFEDIDRDYNSAINLLKLGETVVHNKSYHNSWEGTLGV